MKKNNIKKWIVSVAAAIGGAIIGGAAGFFGTMYLDKAGISGFGWIWVPVALVVAVYLQIIVHEAGHLVCGLLSGYKFVSFRVDRFMIYKKQGKLHWGNYMLAGTGGQCLMAPPEMEDGTIPYRLYNFGGALANLIFSGVAAVLGFVCSSQPIIVIFCAVTVIIGVFFAATNGIPIHTDTIDNDGYNAMSLGKQKEALRALWVQLKVNEMQTEGIRLKDMPEEWFQKPTEEGMKNSMIATIEVMRCNRLLDMHLFKETSQAIDAAFQSKNGMVGVHKMLLKLDQIYCEVIGEQRETILNQMEEKELIAFMKTMKTFPSVLRAQYAYSLLIEKEQSKAQKILKQFETVIKTHPYEGDAQSEWEFIRLCQGESERKTQN